MIRVEANDWIAGARASALAQSSRRWRPATGPPRYCVLTALGVGDSAVNLRNKVARGKFSAAFLLQCLAAIGARNLRLTEDGDD